MKTSLLHEAWLRSPAAPLGTGEPSKSHLFLLGGRNRRQKYSASHNRSCSNSKSLLTLDRSHLTYSSPSSFLWVASLLYCQSNTHISNSFAVALLRDGYNLLIVFADLFLLWKHLHFTLPLWSDSLCERSVFSGGGKLHLRLLLVRARRRRHSG